MIEALREAKEVGVIAVEVEEGDGIGSEAKFSSQWMEQRVGVVWKLQPRQ